MHVEAWYRLFFFDCEEVLVGKYDFWMFCEVEEGVFDIELLDWCVVDFFFFEFWCDYDQGDGEGVEGQVQVTEGFFYFLCECFVMVSCECYYGVLEAWPCEEERE